MPLNDSPLVLLPFGAEDAETEESQSGSTRLPKMSWDDMSCLCSLNSKLGPLLAIHESGGLSSSPRQEGVMCREKSASVFSRTSNLGSNKRARQDKELLANSVGRPHAQAETFPVIGNALKCKVIGRYCGTCRSIHFATTPRVPRLAGFRSPQIPSHESYGRLFCVSR
jgi:hypothetical protein